MNIKHDAEYLIDMKVPEVLDKLVKDLLVKRPPNQLQACFEMCNLAGEMYMEMEANEEEESVPDTNDITNTVQTDNTCITTVETPHTLGEGKKKEHYLGCGLKKGTILGKGAFGMVFKALDGHGTLYAVKVLSVSSPSLMEGALEEYSILKQLGHKNIVRVWDFHYDSVEMTADIVMSYWTQGSVAHQINEFGSLPMYTVRKYSIQILAGLGYLHNCQIVHKDMKPQNILADTTGSVALTDFGLSSCVDAASDTNIETAGSPPYMSPMVVTTGHHTVQSDLWAYGCCLLNMATAKMGWSGAKFDGPPGDGWGPSAYMYAAGKAVETGQHPLNCPNALEGLPEDFHDFCVNCFTAEKKGFSHQKLNRHAFLVGKKATDENSLDLTFRKVERTIPLSGRAIVFPSELHLAKHDQLPAHVEALLTDAISTASPFSFTDIKPCKESVGYNNTSYKREKMFCTRKRPAHVLLQKLGRTDNREPIEPGNPNIVLDPILLSRQDEDYEVVINAAEIDKCAKEEYAQGTHDDPEFPGEDDGPSAKDIYGGEEFRITIGELKSLARSLHVETTDALTLTFYTDLVEFTSKCEYNKDCQLFWSVHRAVPLIHLGQMEQELKLLEVINSDISCITKQIEETEAKIQEELDSAERSMLNTKKREFAMKKSKALTHKACVDRFIAAIELLSPCKNARSDPLTEFMKKFDSWRQHVMQFPFQVGFSSAADAKMALALSLSELCNAVCVSQEGYFLADGCNGAHNQLAPLPTQPCAFLTATGLDFMTPASTVIEAAKYFERPPQPEGVPEHEGWQGFKPHAQYMLKERIKTTYDAILASAKFQGAKNLSMLPMGLGMFLKNIHPDDRGVVREAYMEAQFELLCERDYGVQTYYLNPGPPDSWKVAEMVLDRLGEAGIYPLCNIVLHSCDAKFLACELSKRCLNAAMLNPSDCGSVMIGLIGTTWETLRGGNFSGETDLASFSTCVLARAGIS